jgi:hypothetical protein
MVIFSFALIEKEPNSCNIRLALEAERVDRQHGPFVKVSQWEVALKLASDGVELRHVVQLPADGSYLDSKGVWAPAREIFRAEGITIVCPIAQPFLHMHMIRKMIEKDGFTVFDPHMNWIGFERRSLQPWCRGPIPLLVYAVKQAATGARGNGGKQVAS